MFSFSLVSLVYYYKYVYFSFRNFDSFFDEILLLITWYYCLYQQFFSAKINSISITFHWKSLHLAFNSLISWTTLSIASTRFSCFSNLGGFLFIFGPWFWSFIANFVSYCSESWLPTCIVLCRWKQELCQWHT